MFTKQHYYQIGAIVARIPDRTIRDQQVDMYCNLFSENPRFDKKKFKDYVQDVVDELAV